MPTRKIQYWVDETYPLSSGDVKKLMKAVTGVFTAAVKGEVTAYFVGNDDVREIIDKLLLSEAKKQ